MNKGLLSEGGHPWWRGLFNRYVLCPMNDLMYYGRLTWIGLVDIHGGVDWTLEGPCCVLLLKLH